MIDITLEEIIERFREAVETIELHLSEDAEGVDAEYNFIRLILTNLELTNEEFDNIGFSDESKLAIAASRIPGLMYLYQLY